MNIVIPYVILIHIFFLLLNFTLYLLGFQKKISLFFVFYSSCFLTLSLYTFKNVFLHYILSVSMGYIVYLIKIVKD